MSKRLFLFLSIFMVASLILAACAPAATPAPAVEEPAAEEPMAEEPATEEPMAEEPATEEPAAEEPAAMYECTDEIGCVEIAPDEPLHIASMLTISGATAFLGEDSKGAVELAIDDRGKLLGHDILYTVEDSGCSAEGGQTAATKVAADPTIIGVIGTNCSSAMTAAMNTISSAGLVILSPSNTAPALTFPDQTWQPGYFRVCHTDLFQGAVAAEFAYNELGAGTAATIHDGSPYADQLQQVFADKFVELGGTVTFQGAVNVGDTDMRTILTSVAADTPDILYYPIFEPEGPFITAQSSEITGLENTTLMGADGLLSDSFPESAGPNAIGMYLSGPYVTGAAYDDFLAKWETKFGGVPPSGFHAFAYDGTNILFDAIEKVAVVQDDGTVYVPRQALRDAIAETSGYQGLTGTLDCGSKEFGDLGTSNGDCATGQALGIFELTEAEVNEGNWPPPVVYTP
jgi:branched-chain amino acid transport system substrate-binding protein